LDAEGVDIGTTLLKLFGYTFLLSFRIPLLSAPLDPPSPQNSNTQNLKPGFTKIFPTPFPSKAAMSTHKNKKDVDAQEIRTLAHEWI
jgi:hypothetical protein